MKMRRICPSSATSNGMTQVKGAYGGDAEGGGGRRAEAMRSGLAAGWRGDGGCSRGSLSVCLVHDALGKAHLSAPSFGGRRRTKR
jgi:hypothetical protein